MNNDTPKPKKNKKSIKKPFKEEARETYKYDIDSILKDIFKKEQIKENKKENHFNKPDSELMREVMYTLTNIVITHQSLIDLLILTKIINVEDLNNMIKQNTNTFRFLFEKFKKDFPNG